MPGDLPTRWVAGKNDQNRMSSTHLSLHYHIVFGTKDHAPMIAPEWRQRLHAWIGGAIRTLGAIPEEIGGVADHIHMLVGFRATHRLADVMRETKSESSRWIHETIGVRGFHWQDGYGAFTVSNSQRAVVRRYIQDQEQHHLKRTFRDEYRAILERCGVEFDPQYL